MDILLVYNTHNMEVSIVYMNELYDQLKGFLYLTEIDLLLTIAVTLKSNSCVCWQRFK